MAETPKFAGVALVLMVYKVPAGTLYPTIADTDAALTLAQMDDATLEFITVL
jgi:hypothetical protein